MTGFNMDQVQHFRSSAGAPKRAESTQTLAHLAHELIPATRLGSSPPPPPTGLPVEPLAALNLEQSQQAQLQQFVDAVPVGVSIYSADGSLIYLNQTAQHLLKPGWTPNTTLAEQVATYQLYLAGTDTPYPVDQLPLSQALAGQAATADNIEARRGTERVMIAVQATPLFDAEGQVLYAIVTFQDITTCKVAEDLLTRYSQELERQVQERTQTLQAEIQERQRLTTLLEQSEAQNQAIITAIPDLMFRVSREGVYLGYVKTNALIDLLPQDYNPVGHHFSEYLPAAVAAHQLQVIEQVLTTQELLVYEQCHALNGQLQHEEIRVIPSGVNEVLFIVRDITDRKATETALQESESRFQKLAASAPGMIYTVVEPAAGPVYFEYISPVFEEIFELPLAAIAPPAAITFTHMHEDDRAAYLAAIAHSRDTLQPLRQEWRIITPTGTVKWLQAHSRPEQRALGDVVWHGIVLDVSDRKRAEAELRLANERLEYLAQTDALTQVANRRRFDQYLAQVWQQAQREQQPLALLLLDVDYFKSFNDAYGHQAGDQCLADIAQAIQQAVPRSTDLVARYGGEEFAVVLPQTNRAGAGAIAERIHAQVQALQVRHQFSAISTLITLSIGISSLIPHPAIVPDQLIQQADQALYQAKQQGRNRSV